MAIFFAAHLRVKTTAIVCHIDHNSGPPLSDADPEMSVGCCFDTKVRRKEDGHKSVGLDNIAERMALNNGRLDVFSIRGLGTCARITIGKEASA